MNINEKLSLIQTKLKAPKDLVNKFGGFKYRSAESILENVKPLLQEYKCSLVLTDDVVNVGERYYIKATAILKDNEKENTEISSSAFAREDNEFKGMSLGQLSGSTCSYARKYALCGLFAIDNGDDLDSLDTRNVNTTPKAAEDIEQKKMQLLARAEELKIDMKKASQYIGRGINALTIQDLEKIIELKERALKGKQQ